jgi:hypothetical protein
MTLERAISAFSIFRRECQIDTYGLPFEQFLPFEQDLVEVLPGVRELPTGDLGVLRESIDLHMAVLLNQYARRMANATVRKQNNKLVECALIAVSLDKDLLDDRDLYRTSTLIIDCIRRRHLNLDPISCFDAHLVLATENRRAFLKWHLTTAPDFMRSLRSMGFGVIGNENDFKYVDQMFQSLAIDLDLLRKTSRELGKEDSR